MTALTRDELETEVIAALNRAIIYASLMQREDYPYRSYVTKKNAESCPGLHGTIKDARNPLISQLNKRFKLHLEYD